MSATGGHRELDDDRPTVRRAAMFPEVDALPGAQAEMAVRHRDAQVHRGQGRPDVRRHVVRSLDGVFEQPIAVGHETIEEALEVRADVGIRVFLNDERRRGVLQVQRAEAGPNPVCVTFSCTSFVMS